MALDLAFPYTGVTQWSVLYAGLRANFVGINDMFTPSAWIDVSSLGSNWSNTNTVSYRKDPLGFVRLKGSVTASGTASSTIFTLPAGYRPLREIRMIMGDDGSSHHGRIYILTNGQVQAVDYVSSGSHAYFDDVYFIQGG